jgi:RNA polymerase sigma-70 factor (ECF subfamily)
VQQGSQEASRELAETYGSHVRRAVRQRLRRQLRSRYDSLDFVQNVWASFFCDPTNAPAIETPAQLVAYLCRLAHNKVIDEIRRSQTQKADVDREQHIDRRDEYAPVYGRDPTPSAVAVFHERYDALVTRQPEDISRAAQLRFEGATYEEIAEKMNVSERHVRRTLNRLQPDGSLRKPDSAKEPPQKRNAG